jgi:hypothetical protein
MAFRNIGRRSDGLYLNYPKIVMGSLDADFSMDFSTRIRYPESALPGLI